MAGLAGLVSVGCAGSAPLDRKMDHIARTLAAVEARGALRCAPRELAIARSHLEFAQLERAQGSLSRVHQHLDVAEENIGAASVLSPSSRCAGAAEAPGATLPASPRP
jgi:OmpA-OmpF porin, OOP family